MDKKFKAMDPDDRIGLSKDGKDRLIISDTTPFEITAVLRLPDNVPENPFQGDIVHHEGVQEPGGGFTLTTPPLRDDAKPGTEYRIRWQDQNRTDGPHIIVDK